MKESFHRSAVSIEESRIKEACGVFGIFNPDGEEAASSIYYGLASLQHRGQESCGIAVCDTKGPKGNMNVRKGMGLVHEVFSEAAPRGRMTGKGFSSLFRWVLYSKGRLPQKTPKSPALLRSYGCFAELFPQPPT